MRILLANFLLVKQQACTSIPYVETTIRNTAKALKEMKTLFVQQKQAKADNANMLFLLMTGTSTDKAGLAAVGGELKALGIKVACIGAGKQAEGLKAELGMVATSENYIRAGALSSIVGGGSFSGFVKMLITGRCKERSKREDTIFVSIWYGSKNP